MKCLVRANNLNLSGKIRNQIVERIEKSFAKMGNKIRFVVVSFQDIKGFRGSKDKRCSLKVVADGIEQVQVVDADSSPQGAFNLALNRARKKFIAQSRRALYQMRETPALPAVAELNLPNKV